MYKVLAFLRSTPGQQWTRVELRHRLKLSKGALAAMLVALDEAGALCRDRRAGTYWARPLLTDPRHSYNQNPSSISTRRGAALGDETKRHPVANIEPLETA